MHVDPVAHAAGEILPHVSVFHHVCAAGGVVVGDADFGSYVLFGDSHGLFHTQFYGQAVSVPSCLAAHVVTALCLVAAYGILDGAGHHVVDAGDSVGRGRTLVEDEVTAAVDVTEAAVESVVFIPVFEYFVVNLREVKPFVFGKSLCHHRKPLL